MLNVVNNVIARLIAVAQGKDSFGSTMESMKEIIMHDSKYDKYIFLGNNIQTLSAIYTVLGKNNKFTDRSSVFASFSNISLEIAKISESVKNNRGVEAKSITNVIGDTLISLGNFYTLKNNKENFGSANVLQLLTYTLGSKIKNFGEKELHNSVFYGDDVTIGKVFGFFLEKDSYKDLAEYNSKFFYGFLPDSMNPWVGGDNILNQNIAESISIIDDLIDGKKPFGEDAFTLDNLAGFLGDRAEAWSRWVYGLLPDDFNPWLDLPRDNSYYIVDPLALDIDGDGIKTVGINGFDSTLFDHNKDGIKTATGWIDRQDALLGVDLDGDGEITNGRELFGDNHLLENGERAETGYQALSQYDDNGDGRIDAQDAIFDKLRAWRDANQDGISQSDELLTMEEAQVQALNLAHTSPNRNLGNGNTLARVGSYVRTDGTEREMGDLHFASNNMFSRIDSSDIVLTEAQQALPNLKGMGRVRDLRAAA